MCSHLSMWVFFRASRSTSSEFQHVSSSPSNRNFLPNCFTSRFRVEETLPKGDTVSPAETVIHASKCKCVSVASTRSSMTVTVTVRTPSPSPSPPLSLSLSLALARPRTVGLFCVTRTSRRVCWLVHTSCLLAPGSHLMCCVCAYAAQASK